MASPNTTELATKAMSPSTSSYSVALVKTEDIQNNAVPVTKVQVAFQKYRIVSIDCPNSCFTAVFSLHLRWLDSSLSESDKEASKAWDAGWEPQWKPRIDFINETEAVDCFRCNYDTDAKGYVRYFGRYRGTFYEPFLLHRFPFDRHYLEIRISTTWPVQVMQYTAYENYQNTLETMTLAAWKVPENPLDVQVEPLPQAPSRFVFSKVTLRCRVERAHMYFFWNAFVPFFLICVLVITTFLFAVEDLGERLQVSLTLLLTAVAFKFVISSSLPQVEYLTVIDRYFLLGVGFIFLVAVENAVVRVLVTYAPGAADVTDRIALYVYGGVWLLLHFFLSAVIYFRPASFFLPWEKVRSAF